MPSTFNPQFERRAVAFSNRITPTTTEPSSRCQFCSLRPKSERISADVGGLAHHSDQEIWMTTVVLGWPFLGSSDVSVGDEIARARVVTD